MANVSSSNGIEKYPKLRFPEFSDPWAVTQLRCLFTKNTRKNTTGAITNVISNSAKNGLIPQKDYFDKDIANAENTAGYYIISKNDFVYNPRKSAEAPYGPISRYSYEEDGIVSPLYLCFSGNEGINAEYFEKYFRSSVWYRYIYMSGDSGARHDRVSIKDETFFEMPIHIPCCAEQEKITAFLSLLDLKIDSHRQLLENLKKYKRGVINKLINELVQSSPQYSFGQLVCIQRGGSPRPIDDYITSDESGINWIKIGDVTPDSLYLSQTKERIKPAGARKSRKVLPGDLILSNSMSFGRPYIMQIEGCIHDGWLLIRDESEVFNKKFLCYYLASDIVMAQYRRFAAGSCVSNLNSDLVGSLQIALPPMPDQEKSAAIFEQIDSRVVNAAKEYEFLCKLKQGLLQQLFI